MDDIQAIIVATATRLFEERGGDAVLRAGRRGAWSAEAWAAIEEAGLPLALLGEEAGGFGLGAQEGLELARLAGRFGAPLPLGETMLANRILADSGLPIASGAATIAILHGGSARNVPWARHVGTIALVSADGVARLTAGAFTTEPMDSISGLPRDILHAVAQAAPSPWTIEQTRAAGAILRTVELAGALQTVTEMTVRYAGERSQFGRPLSKQQAIQQQLAVLATQAAATNAAATMAMAAFGRDDATLPVAAAKSRASEAAGIAAAIAHQVHGAIGFTAEHALHLYTRLLWGLRDEYGSAAAWNGVLGRAMIEGGADAFWPAITNMVPQLEQAA